MTRPSLGQVELSPALPGRRRIGGRLCSAADPQAVRARGQRGGIICELRTSETQQYTATVRPCGTQHRGASEPARARARAASDSDSETSVSRLGEFTELASD